MLRLSKTEKSVILATIFGSVLEWYDIFLYLYWTPVISHYFFNSKESLYGELSTLLIFAVGLFSRPLGGIIFGHIGDHFGRKNAFILSIFIISVPSVLIGFLPSYRQVGIFSPLLLLLLRFIQGIPVGGELPGIMCYLSETASEKNKNLMGSFTFFGVGIGVMIGIMEYFFLEWNLSSAQLTNSAWRISFIVGGLLGFVGFYLRSKLHETPGFSHLKIEGKALRKPVLYSLRKCSKKIIVAFFCSILPAVGFFVITTFPSFYLKNEVNKNDHLKLIFILLFISTFTLPIFGRLTEKCPVKPFLVFSALSIIIFSPIFYWIFLQNSILLLSISGLLLVLFLNFQFALLPTLLVRLFPITVRYSGIGLSFNLCDSMVGGLTPLFSLYLVHKTANAASFVILLSIAAVLSLISLFFIKKSEIA